MEEIKISSIVDILLENPVLIHEIWRFSDLLETKPETAALVRLKFNRDIYNYRDSFTEVLRDWVSRNVADATITSLANILLRMGCKVTSDILAARFNNAHVIKGEMAAIAQSSNFTEGSHSSRPSASSITSKRMYNCGEPYNYFSGRESELIFLSDFVSPNTTETKRSNILLIAGLAGVGKTELTRKFCKNMEQTNCLWFAAESETTLKQELKKVAKNFRSAIDENENKETFKEILQLSQDALLIIVFDNVDIRNELVEDILSEFSDNDLIKFIITSRDLTMLQEFGPEIINLDVLPLETTVSFLLKVLNLGEEERKNVLDLCKEIQCYTLALRQAVAFISLQQKVSSKGKSFNVSDYLEKIRGKEKYTVFGMERFDHRYKASVLKSMAVTLDYISTLENGEETARLLRLIYYLRPDVIEYSELSDFVNYLSRKTNEIKIEGSIQILKSYCLIKSENNIISVHRMVQEITKYYYQDKMFTDLEALYKSDDCECESKEGCKIKKFCALQLEKFSFHYEVSSKTIAECQNKKFPDFLRKRYPLFMHSILLAGSPSPSKGFIYSLPGNWWTRSTISVPEILEFVPVLNTVFGTIAHPAIAALLHQELGHLTQKLEIDSLLNLCESLWNDTFLSKETFELYSKDGCNELGLPEKFWKEGFIHMICVAEEVGTFFENKGNLKKCLTWREREFRLLKYFYAVFLSCHYARMTKWTLPNYLRILIKLGKRDEAERILNEVLQLFPDLSTLKYFDAFVHLKSQVPESGDRVILGIDLKDIFRKGIARIISSYSKSEKKWAVGSLDVFHDFYTLLQTFPNPVLTLLKDLEVRSDLEDLRSALQVPFLFQYDEWMRMKLDWKLGKLGISLRS